MKKALAIAGILALSITPTASFGGHAFAEHSAIIYESGKSSSIGPNWTSWTECYVNNHADLRAALPHWVNQTATKSYADHGPLIYYPSN